MTNPDNIRDRGTKFGFHGAFGIVQSHRPSLWFILYTHLFKEVSNLFPHEPAYEDMI